MSGPGVPTGATPGDVSGGRAPALLVTYRTKEVPPVAGDVSEHGEAAIGLVPRGGDELDADRPHALVTGVEVVDTQEEATAAAGGRDVSIGGGADVIRQALAAGYVDELAISTAPVVLGAGKRLFDGFTHDVDLEVRRVYTSPYATHVRYKVKRASAR